MRDENSSMITTITPYWNREEALRVWLAAVQRATCPGVHHLVFFVGQSVPRWVLDTYKGESFSFCDYLHHNPGDRSIGSYHNMGAEQSTSEWIMKLDVDALPNVNYFRSLLPILKEARPRDWFNGGMFYLNRYTSSCLTPDVVIDNILYRKISTACMLFGGSNFICRRKDYLELGGCDPAFRGWGWEDYQQLYMLEAYQRQASPLVGNVSILNVTQRCRDEISRLKAQELRARCQWLGLLHRWHPIERSHPHSDANRKTLLRYIQNH